MKTLLPAACIVLTAGFARPASAQGFGLEALGTLEAWKTDAGSVLLARNASHPALYGQAYAWLVYQPDPQWRFMAVGWAWGNTGESSDAYAELQMLSVRWWHSRAVRIEAGRILPPIGEFAARHFANVNPLIGEPDSYGTEYPWGVNFAGGAGRFDYSASVVSLPAVNPRYTPAASSRMRPAIGVGFTPDPRVRMGVSFTRGSYLGDAESPQLPASTSWQDFQQTIGVVDLRYSSGRFDTRGEATWSSYAVPTAADPVRGFGWYAESRMTVSPRVFIAARVEHNRYAFVQPVSPVFWVGVQTTQMNAELGLGYRLSSEALIKASFRRDHWPVHQRGTREFPDGYALAAQVSLQADVLEALRRKP